MPDPKPTLLSSVRMRLDSWKSTLTGLGTIRDKLTSLTFDRSHMEISDDELEALFDGDDMAALCATAAPDHMLRQGFSVKTGAPDVDETMNDTLEKLGVLAKVQEALVWENVFGGAAIIVGCDDGLPMDQPLNLDSLRSVRYLNVLDKRDLWPTKYFNDPLGPNYGDPEVFEIRPTTRVATLKPIVGQRVHVSRMVIFPGLLASARTKRDNKSWGNSRLRRTYVPLRIFGANWTSASHLLQDASQGVFKLKNLIQMISSPDGKEALQTRMEVVDMGRSVARSLMLDADAESFERKDTTFTGLPEMLDRTAQRLSSASRVPVSLLMGREPAGLNSTGDAETRGWYDTLGAERTQRVVPRMKQLIRLVFHSRLGPTGGVEPKGWDLTFPSFWQPLPDEQADIELKHAQSDQIRIASGVFTPEEVSIARYTQDGYQNDISVAIAKSNDALARAATVEASAAALTSDPLAPRPPAPQIDPQQQPPLPVAAE